MTKSIETIAVVGAGALGAAYAGILYDMDNRCVSFVAGGDRYERLSSSGLIINGKHYGIPVLRPENSSTPADLVIVAVKNQHLPAALRDLKNRVGAETIIISVMNGLESEEQIGAVYGREKVLYAISVGIDALREENRVNYARQGKIYFGEAKNTILTERVKRVQELFDKAGIAYETPPDMIHALWWKFMINVGINQASAVLRAPFSLFQTSPAALELMQSAMREVILLSAKTGVHLTEEDIDQASKVLSNINPLGKTSMLQDIEAGRKTEVEMFAGKVIELGRKMNVPTPINQQFFDAIRKIEAENSPTDKT
ncbi:MAG: 2-dehydropantoate 2-reductase [Deltaproteobacteria bacterium HGW-Deltaproteobacteria-12]|nr:MAG: 2-dehydropantoate 2-reductase [Deltaproteobacteria bacterium HGW-Deltaproteobacteria-12]